VSWPAGDLAAVRILRTAVAAGRWARPFLLAGPVGGAREESAEAFARAVLCAAPPRPGEACGTCGACGRVARDLHPDLHRLVAARDRVRLGVDPVESLQGRLALKPLEGRGAVVVVPDAERMTGQAQNSFLRTLEEPPPRTALLLLTAAPRGLLATVRSRCVTVRFPPAPAAAFDAAAEEAGLPAAAAALVLAFRPREPRREDPLAGAGESLAWVRGGGRDLESQRARLRALLRLLLAAHSAAAAGTPVPGGVPPAGYDGMGREALRARLRALEEARERVERFVDPGGVLEALAVAFEGADRRPGPSAAAPSGRE